MVASEASVERSIGTSRPRSQTITTLFLHHGHHLSSCLSLAHSIIPLFSASPFSICSDQQPSDAFFVVSSITGSSPESGSFSSLSSVSHFISFSLYMTSFMFDKHLCFLIITLPYLSISISTLLDLLHQSLRYPFRHTHLILNSFFLPLCGFSRMIVVYPSLSILI